MRNQDLKDIKDTGGGMSKIKEKNQRKGSM